MAAEWRMDMKGEQMGARRVCDRVYETLQDFQEEVQEGGYEYDSPAQALAELRERLTKVLPFDPEEL